MMMTVKNNLNINLKKLFLSIKNFFFPGEALVEEISENPISILLYFYSPICIRNFTLRIGDKEIVMVGDIPASVKISALTETRVVADFDVVSYGEIICLHDIEISIPDIYVEGNELSYQLTIPKEIDQEDKIIIYPDGYKK